MLSRLSITLFPTASASRLALRGVPSSAVFSATTNPTVSPLTSTPRRFVSDTPRAKKDDSIKGELLLALLEDEERKRNLRRKVRTLPKPSVNPPKKPMSAYLHFCEEHRAGVTALPEIAAIENKSDKNHEVVKKLGEMWRALSETEKEPFETKAKASTEAYQTAHTAYLATRTPQDEYLEQTRHSLLSSLNPSKKRAKVAKNPDEPRRPDTAYQLFLKDRGFMGKGAEGLKDGGAAWKEASDEETQVYHAQAEKLKDAYEDQIDAYLETHDVTQFKKSLSRKTKKELEHAPLSSLEMAKQRMSQYSRSMAKKHK
ncbi:hypothetical protein HDU98_011643 [Podochytrium sp. JEL0797]|nr:hypothetical protein HDU98_011643 [Podochytrium sp. JEL0797]